VPVSLERSGRIGILRLQRPERANALNRQLLESLASIQESLRTEREIRVLVTTGEGKGFSAGSDLDEIAWLSAEEATQHQLLEGRVCRSFLSLPQPTIAAVHGYALGGGLFLAAYHDFRIIAAGARLGLPEVKLGWNPTFGMARLIRLAGASAATRWLMSAEEFSAEEARRLGVATAVVAEGGDVLGQALDLGERLAALPGAGLAAIKEALWREEGAGYERSDAIEAELFGRCLGAPEGQASLLRYKEARAKKGKSS
jgi:enoyl-CoA hydratase